jgi:hypothetical protein
VFKLEDGEFNWGANGCCEITATLDKNFPGVTFASIAVDCVSSLSFVWILSEVLLTSISIDHRKGFPLCQSWAKL